MPYIGKEPEHGNYQLLDALTLPDGVFNGARTVFNLTADSVAVYPGSPASLLISLGGVLQEPTTTYTVSGGQITFTTAPATGTDFFGVSLGDTLDIGTPSDASVTAAKIADDAVTAAKLANSINTDIAANTAKTGITSGQASAITANTAKVTNATHTGDVTGATALTIAADAVTTVKIANDQVTGAKLNPALVVGDIIYADGTDTITRLAKPGTPAGEVLTFATSATAPSWAAVGGTSYAHVHFSIAMTTAAGTQAITGVGFTSKRVFFTARNTTDYKQHSEGVEDWPTGGSDTRFMWYDGSNETSGVWSTDTTNSILVMPTASTAYRGKITTMGSDGFTITWVRTGAPSGTLQVHAYCEG
jgi:hypothetical protein